MNVNDPKEIEAKARQLAQRDGYDWASMSETLQRVYRRSAGRLLNQYRYARTLKGKATKQRYQAATREVLKERLQEQGRERTRKYRARKTLDSNPKV
jgi:hypothetical protein